MPRNLETYLYLLKTMRFQDFLAESTLRAFAEAFWLAESFSPEQLTWTPLDRGESVLSLSQRLAALPQWALHLLASGDFAEWAPLDCHSIAACHKIANDSLFKLQLALRDVADHVLDDEHWTPVEGGRDLSMREIMDLPRTMALGIGGQLLYLKGLSSDAELARNAVPYMEVAGRGSAW